MISDEILEEHDLDFSSDEAAEESMKEYIRENFSDLLGDKMQLLDAPNGLELLLQEIQQLKDQAGLSQTDSAQVA